MSYCDRSVMTYLILILALLLLPGIGNGEGDLSVSGVSTSSAVLHWRQSQDDTVDFKVYCAGLRYYTTADGSSATDIDRVIQFAPRNVESIPLTHLQPNFDYSCILEEENGVRREADPQTTKPCFFSTSYGSPEVPQVPMIEAPEATASESTTTTEDNQELFKVHLLPVSSKYGPISSYEVQFHVVQEDDSNDLTTMDPSNIPPTSKPDENLATLEEAQASSEPVSFVIHYDNTSQLPEELVITKDLLHKALKDGTAYRVVFVAITVAVDGKDEGDQTLLWTASASSEPLTISKNRKLSFREQYTKKAACILLGGLMPLLVIMGCLGLYIAYKKCESERREKERFDRFRKNLDKSPSLTVDPRKQMSEDNKDKPPDQKSFVPPLHLLDDEELISFLDDVEAILGGDCEQSVSSNPARTKVAGQDNYCG